MSQLQVSAQYKHAHDLVAQNFEQIRIQEIRSRQQRQGSHEVLYSIDEGIVEVSDQGSYSASLWTEEGKHILLLGTYSLPRLFQTINDSIEQVHQAGCDRKIEAQDSLQALTRIWERLERLTENVAAKTNLISKKLPPLKQSQSPDWLTEAIQNLEAPSNSPHVAAADKLIRSSLFESGTNQTASLDVDTFGRIQVDWNLPNSQLQWLVTGSDLGWPLVTVHQLSWTPADSSTQTQLKTRIFHTAIEAVEEFTRLFKDIENKHG